MTFCAPRRVVICVASLQDRLGLTTKDADFSAVWLTRDQFGMTFLDQLGLMFSSVFQFSLLIYVLAKPPLQSKMLTTIWSTQQWLNFNAIRRQ